MTSTVTGGATKWSAERPPSELRQQPGPMGGGGLSSTSTSRAGYRGKPFRCTKSADCGAGACGPASSARASAPSVAAVIRCKATRIRHGGIEDRRADGDAARITSSISTQHTPTDRLRRPQPPLQGANRSPPKTWARAHTGDVVAVVLATTAAEDERVRHDLVNRKPIAAAGVRLVTTVVES